MARPPLAFRRYVTGSPVWLTVLSGSRYTIGMDDW